MQECLILLDMDALHVDRNVRFKSTPDLTKLDQCMGAHLCNWLQLSGAHF